MLAEGTLAKRHATSVKAQVRAAGGELKGPFAGTKAESVFSFDKLLMSVLSATLLHLCVSMRARGMLMRGLPIPCGPRRRVYYASKQSSESELCL